MHGFAVCLLRARKGAGLSHICVNSPPLMHPPSQRVSFQKTLSFLNSLTNISFFYSTIYDNSINKIFFKFVFITALLMAIVKLEV